MRSGSPGFISQRLAQARRSRGMSMVDLAREVQVSRQMISQYESGQQTPSPEVLERIAKILSFNQTFFMWPMPMATREGPVFWRSMASATKTSRERALSPYEWMIDIRQFVSQWIDMPKVDFPELMRVGDPERIADSSIEDLATKTRRHWGMGDGPIENVVWLLENKGAVVSRLGLDADKLDGQSQWIDGRPHILLNADKGSAVRSRFDAAHELGHLILHRGIDSVAIHRSSEHKLLEQQANTFASAFLMPQKTFSAEVHSASLDQFRALKGRWKVAIAAMLMRSSTLGLVADSRAEYLWISYSRKGWRKCEPLDDVLPVEQPRMLKQAIAAIVNNEAQSRGEIISTIPIGQGYIEELAGLERGFLSSGEAEIVTMPKRNFTNSSSKQETTGRGDLIPFPSRRPSSDPVA